MSPAIEASNVTVTIAGDTATVTVACDFPMVVTGYHPATTVRLERSATYRIPTRPGD